MLAKIVSVAHVEGVCSYVTPKFANLVNIECVYVTFIRQIYYIKGILLYTTMLLYIYIYMYVLTMSHQDISESLKHYTCMYTRHDTSP